MDANSFEKIEVKNRAELWEWFERNHTQEASIWLVTWKRHWEDRYLSREAVLDAVIAYGWIDERRMVLDKHRTMQLLSRRRQQAWAQTYINRANRLIEEGKMKASGIASIEGAKSSGKYRSLAHVDDLIEPASLISALERYNAKDWWHAAAPSYRRNVLRWVASGKKEVTKENRVEVIAEHASKGKKVPQY